MNDVNVGAIGGSVTGSAVGRNAIVHNAEAVNLTPGLKGEQMVAEWAAALAASGAGALVSAAATDAWQSARAGFARLFGRGDGRRGELVASRLDATAAEITGARSGEQDAVRRAAMAAWQTRLTDLLDEEPEAAAALRDLIGEVTAALQGRSQPVQMQVSRTGPAVTFGGGAANSGVIMGDQNAGGR